MLLILNHFSFKKLVHDNRGVAAVATVTMTNLLLIPIFVAISVWASIPFSILRLLQGASLAARIWF